MYAYAQAMLDDDTIHLTRFPSGDKLFTFMRRFDVLKRLPTFFAYQMSSFFKDLIRHRYALTCFDDILLTSKPKPHTLQFIKQLHDIGTKGNLKMEHEKHF